MSSAPGGDPGEMRALLVLDHTPTLGPARIRALVEAFGSAQAALAAPRPAFAALAGAAAAQGRGDPAVGRAVDAGLRKARDLGMATCTWTSDAYPTVLRRLADPPPVLFLRGRMELLGAEGVTIVGARRATGRGRDVASRLGEALGAAGVTVVSGLALGVDGAAHRGALSVRGDTIAVLGRGADEPYPASHRVLFGQIVERGLVVSEFLPGTPPLAYHFPRRNRILAALGRAVVVVEAAARSGALITVDHALDLGRDVWAVPGPIDTHACEGSNQLLADGAQPLISVSAFVRELTGLGPDGSEGETSKPASGPEGLLLETLAAGPLHVDELASRAGLPVPTALAVLATLEIRGSVEQMPGMLFRRAA